MDEHIEANAEKKGKAIRQKKAKKINLTVAPYNWRRMKSYIKSYNESETRTGPKLKYTDIINEAIGRYISGTAGK